MAPPRPSSCWRRRLCASQVVPLRALDVLAASGPSAATPSTAALCSARTGLDSLRCRRPRGDVRPRRRDRLGRRDGKRARGTAPGGRRPCGGGARRPQSAHSPSGGRRRPRGRWVACGARRVLRRSCSRSSRPRPPRRSRRRSPRRAVEAPAVVADLNAVSPSTAREVGSLLGRCGDRGGRRRDLRPAAEHSRDDTDLPVREACGRRRVAPVRRGRARRRG